ncbi:MAG: DUF1800 domain-containing protein [Archangium sp.]
MRALISGLLLLSCASASAPRPAPKVTLPPPSRERVTHLLNRAAFGPSPADVAEVERIGPQAWLAGQLQPGVDAALTQKLSGFKTLDLSIAQAFDQYSPPKKKLKEAGIDADDEAGKRRLLMESKDELPRQLILELSQARMLRAIESRRQLEEVLVDFWFNHFNVSAEKGRVKWMVTSYERDAIRPFVFGKFRDLLGATAKHPAMLFYLDNWQSVRDGFEVPRRKKRMLEDMDDDDAPKMPRGLNENYARELMELHTLGVDAGYTQNDVREAARALTGWSLVAQPKKPDFGSFIFRPMTHDDGAKVVFGLKLAAGGGQGDGEKLLDYLARHPATAQHLARKMCQRFVSDSPPKELVDRIAAKFTETDGDLRAVTRAIFESPEFWNSTDAKTKTPLEFVASSIRAVGTVNEVRPILARTLEGMGQPLYRCTPPTGFAENANAWVSAGALVARINFGLALTSNRIPGVSVSLPAGEAEPQATIDAVAARVLGHPPTSKTRETLMNALVAKEQDGEVRPLEPSKVAGLLLGSPEFQHQ